MIPAVPTTYDEFRSFYRANEACDDGSELSLSIMNEIAEEYPEWYSRLMSENTY